MKNYKKYGDGELLYFISQDDNAAFTEIYNRFWQQLFAIAFNRIKETETAEDIVHDVFAGLWANRSAVEIESLENYLAVAAKYAVLTKLKKKLREREWQKNNASAPVTELTIEASFHYKRILELVHAEVERLPEKCRIIFKYSREQSMPVKEIATALKISPKTVENQLTKALRQLKVATRSFLQLFFF